MKQKYIFTSKILLFVLLCLGCSLNLNAYIGETVLKKILHKFWPITTHHLNSHTQDQKGDIDTRFDGLSKSKTESNQRIVEKEAQYDANLRAFYNKHQVNGEQIVVGQELLQKQQKQTDKNFQENGEKISGLNQSAQEIKSKSEQNSSRASRIFSLATSLLAHINKKFANLRCKVQKHQEGFDLQFEVYTKNRDGRLNTFEGGLKDAKKKAEENQNETQRLSSILIEYQTKQRERGVSIEDMEKKLKRANMLIKHNERLRQQHKQLRIKHRSSTNQTKQLTH